MKEQSEQTPSITLEDVARLAGVSGMTVSRVLQDHVNVSEQTRAKVQAAVAALGYVPNRLAGALTTAKTRLIAVIVPSLSNIVFPEVLRGANECLEAAGYQAVIGVSDYDLEKEERIIAAMRAWRPSGWILAGLEHTPRALQMLRVVRSPVVEVMDSDGEPIDMAVGFSNTQAGRDTGQFLADTGRRRVGYVGGDLCRDLRAAKRRKGFEQALAENGLELEASFTAQQASSFLLGRAGLAQLLERHPDLDAVYFSNDDMAVGGLMHCMGAGVEVPGRLALAGFNGLEIGEAVPQRLTTIRSPRYRIGQLAAEHILARLAGNAPPLRLDLGYEFITGQTT
ncbi:LacI family DNA-binding transcriptional regulator [Variovorax fucosicus]|uniref:LacI family DNA-binding transcriptional regulator n=1 Tax=Variovorax fucosicus TaxID=3053517 RepID=UPI00257522F8|nr:LacI family DNA-binding transcriptional regulator [Variovorax sp. J22G47]MDM0057614.1 LacI family DNA-binding transcriptional regulator [Variovorax sp. J22G47]